MTAPALDAMFQNVPAPKKDEPPAEIERDRWGRPLIIQPDGSKKPYVRASTMAGAIDDKTALGDWKARMTGRGVSMNPDLIAGFAAIPDMTTKEGKRTANELAEQAQERAGSSTKRVIGTAFHSFTERFDRGERGFYVPTELQQLMNEYVRVTAGVQWLAFEQFLVTDELECAGTTDRIGVFPGQLPRIWDLKSGRVDFPLKFAIQLAIYARGKRYNPATGQRASFPAIDLKWAYILHTDPETNRVQRYRVDIEKGWEYAHVARAAYLARKDKKIMELEEEIFIPEPTPSLPQRVEAVAQAVQSLPPAPELPRLPGVVAQQQLAAQPAVPISPAPTTPLPGETREQHAARVKAYIDAPLPTHKDGSPKSIMQRLAACTTLDHIRALYAETGHEWTERHQKFSNIMAEQIRGSQPLKDVMPQ